MNVGIGEYKEERWRDNRRAYCDDRFKLSVLFPTDLHSPRVYKNAPFDVCESKLTDTFFDSWDQIKHNIIFIGLTWLNRRRLCSGFIIRPYYFLFLWRGLSARTDCSIFGWRTLGT